MQNKLLYGQYHYTWMGLEFWMWVRVVYSKYQSKFNGNSEYKSWLKDFPVKIVKKRSGLKSISKTMYHDRQLSRQNLCPLFEAALLRMLWNGVLLFEKNQNKEVPFCLKSDHFCYIWWFFYIRAWLKHIARKVETKTGQTEKNT